MSKNKIGVLIIVAATAYASLSHADGMANYPESIDGGPGRTREQVVQELLEFKRNPVVNGWRQVDSEPMWIYVGTSQPGESREQVQRELETFQRDRAAQARYARTYGAS